MSWISEILSKKRDGEALSRHDISLLIEGITNHQVTDAQIAAFTMATWFREMTAGELRDLTVSMRDSGMVLQWSGLDGPVVDKHSTGGVGDLVSLVLAPMVAACGAYVPMISGRGLGHTGGTLDKLESIPGFNTSPGRDEFQRLVREQGLSIIGQTDDLAPADRRIYAVRDVTATVASMPLIVSSILSKKLAEGLDALVMDIKVGSGAFMETVEDAHSLAARLCNTSTDAGLRCNAILTDMDQAMSYAAGNALEVQEAIDYLKGDRCHPRLHAVVMAIAAEMLVLSGLNDTLDDAHACLQESLDSGRAAEKFARMIRAQGGPGDLLVQAGQHLAVAPVIRPLIQQQSAWISSMHMTQVGSAVVRLGGGRLRAEDTVDHSVGLSALPTVGTYLEKGSELVMIHARNENDWQQAADRFLAAIEWVDEAPANIEATAILDRVEGSRTKL